MNKNPLDGVQVETDPQKTFMSQAVDNLMDEPCQKCEKEEKEENEDMCRSCLDICEVCGGTGEVETYTPMNDGSGESCPDGNEQCTECEGSGIVSK